MHHRVLSAAPRTTGHLDQARGHRLPPAPPAPLDRPHPHRRIQITGQDTPPGALTRLGHDPLQPHRVQIHRLGPVHPTTGEHTAPAIPCAPPGRRPSTRRPLFRYIFRSRGRGCGAGRWPVRIRHRVRLDGRLGSVRSRRLDRYVFRYGFRFSRRGRLSRRRARLRPRALVPLGGGLGLPARAQALGELAGCLGQPSVYPLGRLAGEHCAAQLAHRGLDLTQAGQHLAVSAGLPSPVRPQPARPVVEPGRPAPTSARRQLEPAPRADHLGHHH